LRRNERKRPDFLMFRFGEESEIAQRVQLTRLARRAEALHAKRCEEKEVVV